MYPACSGLGKLESHGRGHLKCIQPIPTGHIGVTCCLYSQCIQHVPGGYLGPCPQCWEQRSPVQNQNNRQQNNHTARKLSAIQRPGPPPQFQQQQSQQEEQDQGQGQRGGWCGGWCGGCGRGGRGMYRGTRTGKNKNQQEQARPIEGEEHRRPASPTPSFHFGEIASTLIAPEPFVPRSIYPNFSNTLSLAHCLGVKPTTETVKTLEVYERAKENAARPSKRPRVNSEEEVDIYWTSDEEDISMFLEDSAGPSSRCASIASPLEATKQPFTGYNTTSATNNTTYVVPYVNDEVCCTLLSELDAEENLNKVSWILDSGASLHYTGDINDFVEYAPLERPIKAATATTTSTDIIGVGTVLMTIEGSEHMIRVAPVYFVPDLLSRLLSLGVCQGGPRRSPEIQSTLVWSSCWGATGSAGCSTQRGEQRRVVRARGNKGEVGVTRDQCRVW